MVLLTIVTTSNPHTLYFDHDLMKPSSIRLLSASIYNSWHNLKKSAAVSTLPGNNGTTSVIPLPAGNYTIDSLAEEFNNMKKIKSSIDLITKTNAPLGSMVINNPNNLRFSVNLVELLGVNPALSQITTIKRLTSPTTYFISSCQ